MHRKRREEMRRIVLGSLKDGPKTKRELLERIGKRESRTLTVLLKELRNKELLIQPARGVYALYTYIPIEEVVDRVRRALRWLFVRFGEAELEEVSREATINPDWRDGNITFSDIVFAEARKIGLKIGYSPVKRLDMDSVFERAVILRGRELVSEEDTIDTLADKLESDPEFRSWGLGERDKIIQALRNKMHDIKPPHGGGGEKLRKRPPPLDQVES